MKISEFLSRFLINFCVITTGITLLEGVLGCIFFSDVPVDFRAFFSPPFFGLLTAMTGLVVASSKPLSMRRMLLRMAIQLMLIECMILGANYLACNSYTLSQFAALALGIFIIYVFVYLVMWLNERRVAKAFNQRLAAFQAKAERQDS